MKNILLFIVLIIPVWLNAQGTDTTLTKKVHYLEIQLDSLQRTIVAMDKEMQDIKQSIFDGNSGIDRVLAVIGVKDVESASFETRSRYKRIDDLLKVIEQRPGQLMFNGNITAINQFSLDKKVKESYGTGSFDIFVTTFIRKGALLFVDLEAVGGNGPDILYPTFSGLNGDAGSTQSPDSIDRLNVLEVWGEFTLFKEIITVTIGKIDITNYFDINASANDETMQFITGSFINNSSFAVPSNSPGIRLRTTILNRYRIQFGLSSRDNAGDKLFHDLYKIASLGWTFAPGTGFESNIRMYGYQVPGTDEDCGFGVSFDKVFYDKYNIFGRYGLNQDSLANDWGVKSSWSAGFRFVQTLKKQPLAVGIAYGENYPAEKTLQNEKLTELYIRLQLNNWVSISPHFQYVWNRHGTNNELNVLGFRTNFNF
ncbi:carbohydrate porin [Saccharicrinis sp. GN24d3]|uniref:carbohydrate porin n=1 Tax=Saccharicrinis sp. GN24d3 TaxID=3458416 RepID=UPI0040367FE4